MAKSWEQKISSETAECANSADGAALQFWPARPIFPLVDLRLFHFLRREQAFPGEPLLLNFPLQFWNV